MDFMEFIAENTLILVPVLMFFGLALKKTPVIKDWLIPYILGGMGIVMAIWMIGLTPDAVAQGILVAGGSVYGHQLLKQTGERE